MKAFILLIAVFASSFSIAQERDESCNVMVDCLKRCLENDTVLSNAVISFRNTRPGIWLNYDVSTSNVDLSCVGDTAIVANDTMAIYPILGGQIFGRKTCNWINILHYKPNEFGGWELVLSVHRFEGGKTTTITTRYVLSGLLEIEKIDRLQEVCNDGIKALFGEEYIDNE